MLLYLSPRSVGLLIRLLCCPARESIGKCTRPVLCGGLINIAARVDVSWNGIFWDRSVCSIVEFFAFNTKLPEMAIMISKFVIGAKKKLPPVIIIIIIIIFFIFLVRYKQHLSNSTNKTSKSYNVSMNTSR